MWCISFCKIIAIFKNRVKNISMYYLSIKLKSLFVWIIVSISGTISSKRKLIFVLNQFSMEGDISLLHTIIFFEMNVFTVDFKGRYCYTGFFGRAARENIITLQLIEA